MQLLTPYRDNGHLTPAQRHFNATLSRQRIDIEHTFGILKQRFRQLYYCKLRGMKLLCHFIRACIVLHNLSDSDDLDFLYPEVLEGNQDMPQVPLDGPLQNGNLMRDAICQNLFLNYA